MSIRCPTCRRQLTAELPDCPRCGTEVQLLQELQQRYDAALGAAAAALARQELEEAELACDIAATIHGHTADVARTYALLALYRRDFRLAYRWYLQQGAAASR